MGLTEVEGFADLLAADTEQQRVLAVQNASGQLHTTGQAWRKELLNCMAHLEVRAETAPLLPSRSTVCILPCASCYAHLAHTTVHLECSC